MWCSQCQQDVPAVVSSRGEQRLCCPRCAQEITPDQEAPLFEPDWSVDEDQFEADLAELAQLQRELAPAASDSSPQPVADQSFLRIDTVSTPPAPQPQMPLPPSLQPSGQGSFRSLTAWLLILLGTSSLFCGAVLIGWSFYAAEPLFWKVGLPIAIGGQAILLMGVVLSLDAAAQNRRQQAEAIWQLQQQQLQQAAMQGQGPSAIVPSPHQLLAEMNARLQ